MISKLISVKVKNFFIISFLTGVSVIFVGNFLNQTYLPLILTILIMLSYYYITITHLLKKDCISSEQFADSNYYLGFLFTLVSLSVTLINLAEDSSNIKILISQFGIAIITTLIGLFIRIYIINFIPNEDANRERFDTIISDKLRMIDSQITHSIDKNVIFSDIIDEKINMFSDQTEKMMQTFREDLVDNLDTSIIGNLISQTTKHLEKTHEQQITTLEKLILEINAANKNYVLNLDSVSSNIENNYEFIKSFNTFMSTLEKSLSKHTESVMNSTESYFDGVNSFQKSLDLFFTEQSKLQKTHQLELRNFVETLKKENTNLISKTNNTTNQTLDNLSVQSKNMLEQITIETSNQFSKNGEIIENGLSTLDTSIIEMMKKYTEAIISIEKTINNANEKSIKESQDTFNNINNNLQQVTESQNIIKDEVSIIKKKITQDQDDNNEQK